MELNEDTVFNKDSKLKLDKVHQAIDRPDVFANIFAKAAESQTKIKDMLRNLMREVLNDDTTKNKMRTMIHEIKKMIGDIFLKRCGVKSQSRHGLL